MTTVYISIGNSDDKLSQSVWATFYRDVDEQIRQYASKVHGAWASLPKTRSFFAHVWPHATALLFIEGRLFFHRPDGTRASMNAGAPSVLIAYGRDNADRLLFSDIRGAYVEPWLWA